jgi:hypothetical protein
MDQFRAKHLDMGLGLGQSLDMAQGRAQPGLAARGRVLAVMPGRGRSVRSVRVNGYPGTGSPRPSSSSSG